ncbi:hypothetical protein Pcinc_022015 [Petrolisthes cinctipes]|uniref:Uncharacterized protein n=1 Tax=Petrolisthes cinctipes TaxID=88211 RepID=A0AAE1FGY1_PETCI|nr:hypothetical protein Pcinc_022015 [Petrolisthes cinctipes]
MLRSGGTRWSLGRWVVLEFHLSHSLIYTPTSEPDIHRTTPERCTTSHSHCSRITGGLFFEVAQPEPAERLAGCRCQMSAPAKFLEALTSHSTDTWTCCSSKYSSTRGEQRVTSLALFSLPGVKQFQHNKATHPRVCESR